VAEPEGQPSHIERIEVSLVGFPPHDGIVLITPFFRFGFSNKFRARVFFWQSPDQ
jgi:hypothetical protein